MNDSAILLVENLNSIADLFQCWLSQNYKLKKPVTEAVFDDETELKKRLDVSVPNETTIFTNVCFKWHPDTKRTEFAGIKRIIKEALRINWLRREPVIAYGTLPEDIILNSPMGQIFKSNLRRTNHYLEKMYKLDRNFKSERKQFLWRLRHVKKIFPDLEAEGTTNTVKLLEEADESKKDKIKFKKN